MRRHSAQGEAEWWRGANHPIELALVPEALELQRMHFGYCCTQYGSAKAECVRKHAGGMQRVRANTFVTIHSEAPVPHQIDQ